MGDADYFSASAGAYATLRPTYPEALIRYVTQCAPGRDLAWDCATGSGQAAVPLAQWFARVVASDASAEQLSHARPDPRVDYRLGTADTSGLDAGTVDLVTVAQALHWIDLPAFYAEVRRVLKPGGALAVWCYARCRVSSDVDAVIDWFYEERVGRYWPPERVHTETGYRDLPFPFDELPATPWEMRASLTRSDLLGYLGTWSSVAVARRTEHVDPVPEVEARLRQVWPSADERRSVTWPLTLRIGRPRPT